MFEYDPEADTKPIVNLRPWWVKLGDRNTKMHRRFWSMLVLAFTVIGIVVYISTH